MFNITQERMDYYNTVFETPGFHHSKRFIDEEMFMYWIFREYANVPITKAQLVADYEYWSSIGSMHRLINHPFMIAHFDEFVEYCTIKQTINRRRE